MAGTVAIGVIAPHGDEAIAEACDDATRDRAVATQRAMEEMTRRVAAADPEVAVVATPHNVHVAGYMAVLTAAQVSGALIPLWHLTRTLPDLPAVVMAPARDLDTNAHVRAGAAVVRAARRLGRRIAVVASADQGHGHAADGPYGFHPESAEFDARVADIVRRNALEELVRFDPGYAPAALADSWWQMLMLQGALEADGERFRAELLAYEAPTYFGMLTAVFERETDRQP